MSKAPVMPSILYFSFSPLSYGYLMPFLIYPFVVTIGPVYHDITWPFCQVNIYFSFIYFSFSFQRLDIWESWMKRSI